MTWYVYRHHVSKKYAIEIGNIISLADKAIEKCTLACFALACLACDNKSLVFFSILLRSRYNK